MTARSELAITLASGLAGWLQLNVSQGLGGLNGEDSARLILAQILNASGRYLPLTSQQPTNWNNDKKRVDLALVPRNSPGGNWYGVIEAKWPGGAFDVNATRKACAQDAMRLTFVETNNLNARFFVLGGSSDALAKLFDNSHSAPGPESVRVAFSKLLSRDLQTPQAELNGIELQAAFPSIGKRIPESVFGGYQGKLKTKLLAKAKARMGTTIHGTVYVWQCARR